MWILLAIKKRKKTLFFGILFALFNNYCFLKKVLIMVLILNEMLNVAYLSADGKSFSGFKWLVNESV